MSLETASKSKSLDGLRLQSKSEPLAPSIRIQTSTSQPLKPLSNSRLVNIVANEMNASSSSQEPGSGCAAAHYQRELNVKASPLSQSSCLVADSDEQSSCCHRSRLAASLTSTESMRACAMEATRHKWRTIGRQLRQISEHYERHLMEATQNGNSNSNTSNNHHQPSRHYRRQNSSHSSDPNGVLASTTITSQCQRGANSCMSAEWSKLLLLICLTITIRSAREFG